MPYILSHRQKTVFHIVQLILVHVAIGVSTPRIFMKNQPRTRATTIALGMGAKSIMFIFYQLITENIERFKRWGSLKAYMIINCLEILFWAAVVFLLIQANISRCVGIGCTLSWVVVGVSIVITAIQLPLAYFYTVEFRESKKAPMGGDPQLYETRREEMTQKDTQMRRVENERGRERGGDAEEGRRW
ncbi:hypothetical protein FKW77_009934 [Venturia effusa]|uniref:Uncharacterized protein n=1 Tax=Venturia effusa TaxID=50376 RepID=A0A517LA14_9PEZI|nr:hypothetical protein FKW77_009934 [Venturia effusa]